MEIAAALTDPELPLPLSQHPVFAAALVACAYRAEVLGLKRGNRQVGQVLVVSRRLGPLGTFAFASRGPVWADELQMTDQIDAMRALRNCRLAMVEAQAEASLVLRQSGFRKVATSAHVAELDLRGGQLAIRARAQGKWRNRMALAEREGVTVTSRCFRGEPDHWLFQKEAEQRREKRYSTLPLVLSSALTKVQPGLAQLFVATRDGAPLAAMLFIRHGPVSTYQIGWSGAQGRAISAHHLILMQAAAWLAERGHLRLDLGTVDTESAPGLARFKLGSGARLRILGGSWLRLPFLP